MVSTYNVEKIAFVELDGFAALRHFVNTNILMPSEYIEVLYLIWPHKLYDDRIGRIRYLIIILGFRLGLRGMEILQLNLSDVRANKHIELNVTCNEYGSLKSSSAKRWIPIYDLLSEDELVDFKEWVYLRKEETKQSVYSRFLFTLQPTESIAIDKVLSIASTYDVIHRVLRDVTGDNAFTFHILRHSFVSWHLLLQEALRIPFIISRSSSQ